MKKAIIILFVLSACNAFAQNNLFVSNGVTLKIDGATYAFEQVPLTPPRPSKYGVKVHQFC